VRCKRDYIGGKFVHNENTWVSSYISHILNIEEMVFNSFYPARLKAGYVEGVSTPKVSIGGRSTIEYVPQESMIL